MDDSGVLPFVNPATGERFGEVAISTPDDVGRALDQMRAAAELWAGTPVAERVRCLRQLQAILIDARDEISATITMDTGKGRQDALIEVFVTVDMLALMLRHAQRWLRRERVGSGLYFFRQFYVEPAPFGVVAVISPWNYPLLLALQPTLAALLAGNCVVLKPSEVTAATGVLIESLIERVPQLGRCVRVVHGAGATGQALVEARPDYIFVTGSTATGKKVMRAASEHVIPLSCELSGKDPMIVLDDADLEAAVAWGVWGAFFNTGQTCMAVERVYVLEQCYPSFVDKAVALARGVRAGYSLDKGSVHNMGPVTLPRQMDIIESQMADALAKGARVLVGGRRSGAFYEPTVLVDVNHSMRIMTDETFGPIMPIMNVHSEAEAIALANDSPFGLSASVWSRDSARAQAVARQLRVGSVIVNDTLSHFGVPTLPFGGVKESGFGRAHGREGLLQFTQPRAFALGGAQRPYDIATLLRRPGHYALGAALLQLALGVTLRQRLAPVRAGWRALAASAKQPRRLARLRAMGAGGASRTDDAD